MTFKIRRVSLMVDDFSREMDWNADLVGLNTQSINIEIEALGTDNDIVSDLPVLVTSRVPNQALGIPTLPVPQNLNVPFFLSEAAGDVEGRILYQLTVSPADIGFPSSSAAAGLLKVATVVRPNGTSEALFVTALSSGIWSTRGRVVQPLTPGAQTANWQTEVPDAFLLMQAGGVEVLEVTIPPTAPGWWIDAFRVYRLIQSAANVFYYSGHGLFVSNCLALDTPTTGAHHPCWLKPADLNATWTASSNLRTVIIAGCSVLSIAFPTMQGPGLEWARFLRTKGGPLTALLGYGSTTLNPPHGQLQAPADDPVGNLIAMAMGNRIINGSNDHARDWLDINAQHHAWNAVALDGGGTYYTITQDIPGTSFYTIHQQQLP